MPPIRSRKAVTDNASADSIRVSIASGNALERSRALEELIYFFNKKSQGATQLNLDAKAYHNLVEALFHCSLSEKKSYLSGKRSTKSTAEPRLASSAKALRMAVKYGTTDMKRKVARAIVDHITQTLPGRDQDEYIEPLLPDYVRALVILLEHPANVEQLAALDGEGWLVCADFLVDLVQHLANGPDRQDRLENDSVRASPAPGSGGYSSTNVVPGKTGSGSLPRLRSAVTTSSSASAVASTSISVSSASVKILETLMQGILYLVSASNAPIHLRAPDLSSAAVRMLRAQNLSLGLLQQTAFATVRCIAQKIRGDNVALVETITSDVLPLVGYWWHPWTTGSQSELVHSTREEILRSLFTFQLHIQTLARRHSTLESNVLDSISEILDALWTEYSKRDDRMRLQISDVTFSSISAHYFDVCIFGLDTQHDATAERRYAMMQVMALLESIHVQGFKELLTGRRRNADDQALMAEKNGANPDTDISDADNNNNNAGKHPRKRRRVFNESRRPNRIRDNLNSADAGMRLTALQVIPFYWKATDHVILDDLSSILVRLSQCISDKEAVVSSWAMIACASCAAQSHARHGTLRELWMQIWQIAARSVSLPGTSRAACVLLHTILEAELIPYRMISDDIHGLVTTAGGPAVLCDSSLMLQLHLLHVRTTILPNANEGTCKSIIHWVFSRWKPAESSFSSLYACQAPSFDLVNLLLACMGGLDYAFTRPIESFGGVISQTWKDQCGAESMMRYLLLLPDRSEVDVKSFPHEKIKQMKQAVSSVCVYSSSGGKIKNTFAQTQDPASSHSAKRAVLDGLQPVADEFLHMTKSWSQRGESIGQMSIERMHSLAIFCLVCAVLLPQCGSVHTMASRDLEPTLLRVVDAVLHALSENSTSQSLLQVWLVEVALYLPPIASTSAEMLSKNQPVLLKIFVRLSQAFHSQNAKHGTLLSDGSGGSSGNSGTHGNNGNRNGHRSRSGGSPMDLDDEFDTAVSQGDTSLKTVPIPRQTLALRADPRAFYANVKQWIELLVVLSSERESRSGDRMETDTETDVESSSGVLPEAFLDQFLDQSNEELLLCHDFSQALFGSDVVVIPEDAQRIVETMGDIISLSEYSCCEGAQSMCIDIMQNFVCRWSDDEGGGAKGEHLEVSSRIGDLYAYLVQKSLPKNSLSGTAQMSLARLLQRLLEVNSSYGSDLGLGLPSCRSTLLSIVRNGNMAVKHEVGLAYLPRLFGMYVLKVHDDLFVDILAILPSEADWKEGISFRLRALAELACAWPTLLRRCIYHIFETPGRLRHSMEHATRCLARVARTLELSSSQELFCLFAPQLLYTWLENDPLEEIPFSIFSYDSLDMLVAQAQAEATALMMMRSQDVAAARMATRLGLDLASLVQRNFARTMAYCVAHDISTAKAHKTSPTSESRLRKLLGRERFMDAVNQSLADITGIMLDLIDQEDPIEKYFARDGASGSGSNGSSSSNGGRLQYAAEIMATIRELGHSATSLPPNQQPMFRAKFLAAELAHLCSRTDHDLGTLWTPALVVAAARRLFSTMRPALGSLHACAVVRKVRVLVCLAGEQATTSYPLEMLLHGLRPCVQDAECAEDALGLTRYLLVHGRAHLALFPSFYAGYALSMLASLRMFLESSQQASTTQEESQFRATRGEAQRFHTWLTKQLRDQYDQDDSNSRDSSYDAFRAITQSATRIRTAGNADKGTPESTLLLAILRDSGQTGSGERRLLNDAARDLVLGMLCGVDDFHVPAAAGRDDVIETDQDAVDYAAAVWKSCRAQGLSKAYLTWAGRVVGRAFSASGSVPDEMVRELQLEWMGENNRGKENAVITSGTSSSVQNVLRLLESLTVHQESETAGLAESALRTIVTHSTNDGDTELLLACQTSLSESLFTSSTWGPYRTPPSDYGGNTNIRNDISEVEEDIWAEKYITKASWTQDVAIRLTRSLSDDVVLEVLRPILARERGFAAQCFPFLVHRVLLKFLRLETRPQLPSATFTGRNVQQQLSEAATAWLQQGERELDTSGDTEDEEDGVIDGDESERDAQKDSKHVEGTKATRARENIKLLVSTLVYLRTQAWPNEKSIADRRQWLNIDEAVAASAASRCGMFKVALQLAEAALSDNPERSGRAERVAGRTERTERTESQRRRESQRGQRSLKSQTKSEDAASLGQGQMLLSEHTDLLLRIYENIDDPDAYYGLPQSPSLASVLARIEYERDGSKALAFRGAQYDSHLRYQQQQTQDSGEGAHIHLGGATNSTATVLAKAKSKTKADSRALVQALSTIGLTGLSHSLLLQQSEGTGILDADSTDSTFTMARRLGIWNLPVPTGGFSSHVQDRNSNNSTAVNLYRAYQGVHQARDLAEAEQAVYDGLSWIMRQVVNSNSSGSNSSVLSSTAATLRQQLGALAALAELDDVLHVADTEALERLLAHFEDHANTWMMNKQYEDVSPLLSCRETTLGMLLGRRGRDGTVSRSGSGSGRTEPTALLLPSISSADARVVETRGLLLSSRIYRFHRALQESLNVATALTELVATGQGQGQEQRRGRGRIDLGGMDSMVAAVQIEAASALWEHGETVASIRLLQDVEARLLVKQEGLQGGQGVQVSRADLLSRIGQQVSAARLESADVIQKRYLEAALKELQGRREGQEAGRVFHQFAVFCDEQLQSVDGLEDLARLKKLRQGKSSEVAQLEKLMSSARDATMRQRYSGHLNKARQWLELDEQELRRAEETREEFVRLSLENYLLALAASDEHNSDALRFTALWLERADMASTNAAVGRHLERVPTRKFASLMEQLTSRLQEVEKDKDDMDGGRDTAGFQKLLLLLVYRICCDHPYHGMYQIWSGVRTRPNVKDAVAVRRQRATERVAKDLARTSSVAGIWQAIDRTSKCYHMLAVEKDNRYRAGQRVALQESQAGSALVQSLGRYSIPPPTLELPLAADRVYANKVPLIVRLEPTMSVALGVSAPKILAAVGSDGKRYRQLVKGGNDDLRQDAIMEQVFAAVSALLKRHRASRQRRLAIRTYKVLPLTASSGLIEFVLNTVPLHEYLMPAHERFHPSDLRGSQCRKEISNVQTRPIDVRVATFQRVAARFRPVMRFFFLETFGGDPDDWFAARLAYTRATAAVSMLGHVLGLGDRHGHNILLDTRTGEVVHIDLGVAFEMGRVLPVPELVPFRLTRDIVDGMGITGTEGVFRRCCEFTLDAMRDETYSIMTILDVLRYDPLYSWSISPVRLAKLQQTRDDAAAAALEQQQQAESTLAMVSATATTTKAANEPSEADRALEVVRKKLSKTLSVAATVNDLINQAADERNLAVLYSGWAAYA